MPLRSFKIAGFVELYCHVATKLHVTVCTDTRNKIYATHLAEVVSRKERASNGYATAVLRFVSSATQIEIPSSASLSHVNSFPITGLAVVDPSDNADTADAHSPKRQRSEDTNREVRDDSSTASPTPAPQDTAPSRPLSQASAVPAVLSRTVSSPPTSNDLSSPAVSQPAAASASHVPSQPSQALPAAPPSSQTGHCVPIMRAVPNAVVGPPDIPLSLQTPAAPPVTAHRAFALVP